MAGRLLEMANHQLGTDTFQPHFEEFRLHFQSQQKPLATGHTKVEHHGADDPTQQSSNSENMEVDGHGTDGTTKPPSENMEADDSGENPAVFKKPRPAANKATNA
jgi:hypothetical protein